MEIDEDDPEVVATLETTRKYISDKDISQEEFDNLIMKIDNLNIL